MRRLFLLFTPAFILPFVLGFVVPPLAIQNLEGGLWSERTLLVNAPHRVISRTTPATGQDTATLSGNWILLPVLASDTSSEGIPSIHFDLATGHFTGFTGCNRMNGSFRVQQDHLSFSSDITLTRTVCPGYNEKQFIINLLRVTQFRIIQGILELRIDNMPVSKWVRRLRPEPFEKTI